MKSEPKTPRFGLWGLVFLVSGLALVGPKAAAQDEDDRLVAKDGDVLIYRGEDGKIKIKKEDGDGEWLAIVDPDEEDRFVFFRSGSDRLGVHAPMVLPSDPEWEDRLENVFELSLKAEDLADRVRVEAFPGVGPLALWSEDAELSRELVEKERESRRIAREARKAEGAERDRLETELDQVLNEIFDRKQEARRESMERLQERADDAQRRLDERERRKQDVVARRKRALMGENDPLEW